MIELASALTLPIAKLLLKSWLGDTGADIGVGLFQLGLKRLGDRSKARTAQHRAEEIADAVVADLERFFANEHVAKEKLAVAALALGDTIEQHVDAAFLVSQKLNAKAIKRALLDARPVDQMYRRAEPEHGLYVRLVGALAPRLRAVAPELPGYGLERDAILLRMAAVADGIDARLAGIEPLVEETARGLGELLDRPQRLAAGYEAQYLRAVATELNRVEIVGLSVDEPARGGELEIAYLSLRAHLGVREEVRRIDFASLLTLLPALGGRILIEGPAGAGKSTLLRWTAIQAARWRLGDALTTDPLVIAPDLDAWLPLFLPEGARRDARSGPQVSTKLRFDPEADAPGDRDDPLARLRAELRDASWLTRLPFFVPLRKTGRKLELDALSKLACTTIGNPPEQWTDEAVPSALLLFDAVDEVQAGPERHAALGVIENWATRFSDALIVVTARPGAVSEHALPNFRRIRLDELDEAQKAEFIEHWHRALANQLGWRIDDPVIGKLCVGARRELEHQRALNDLAANPLLCASIAALHWDRRREAAKAARRANASLDVTAAMLPGTRWELFSDLMKMLLHRREQESPDFDTRSYPAAYQLDLEQKRAALARIAYGMVEHDMRSTMRRGHAEERVGQALADMRASVDAPNGAILDALVERSGVLRAAGEDEVEFIHNTLKAFLAAQRYLALGEPPTLVRKLADADVEELASGLDEVAVFCAASPHSQRFAADLMSGLLKKATTLAAKGDENRTRALRILAVRCEAAAGTDMPDERRRPVREMAPTLFPPRTMEEARDLAALGEEAIELLAPATNVPEEFAAACVRCLRLIGMHTAREAMRAFLATESLVVAEELIHDHNPLDIAAVLKAAQDFGTWDKVPPTIKAAVRDLAPLANLTNLRSLSLSGTRVADAAPLANLTNLQTLSLSDTQVADAAPLANLTNLRELQLDGTQVADAAPLANLTNLQRLFLSGTQVADAAPLANLTNLQWLSLYGTQVADAAPLANLTNLQTLGLDATQVADAAPLANLTNLQTLGLDATQVADAAPLANLTNLQRLYLAGTRVADAAPLANLTNLQMLGLDATQVADAAPLANLTNLQWLSLDATQVADAAPLAKLTNLQTLYLSGTQVADAAPLAKLTNLQTLFLDGTQVADAAPLAKLTNLLWLSLAGTHVADAAPLANLTNLRSLDLSETRVTQEQVAELKRAFAARGNRSVDISGP